MAVFETSRAGMITAQMIPAQSPLAAMARGVSTILHKLALIPQNPAPEGIAFCGHCAFMDFASMFPTANGDQIKECPKCQSHAFYVVKSADLEKMRQEEAQQAAIQETLKAIPDSKLKEYVEMARSRRIEWETIKQGLPPVLVEAIESDIGAHGAGETGHADL